jgi:hypothetical protein
MPRKQKQHVIHIDPAEPKNLFPIMAWQYIVSEIVFISLGLIGAIGAAFIPIIILFVLGEVMDSIIDGPAGPSSSSEIVTTATNLIIRAKAGDSINQFSLYM